MLKYESISKSKLNHQVKLESIEWCRWVDNKTLWCHYIFAKIRYFDTQKRHSQSQFEGGKTLLLVLNVIPYFR